MPVTTGYRSFLSTDDLTDDELHALVARGVAHSRGELDHRPLAGAVVGVYFRMTSTRTRVAFSTAALRLGGQIVPLGPNDLQTNTGESDADTGAVLARMLDVLVARVDAPLSALAGWAGHGRMAVVNAMAAEEHPTQAVTDLVTLTCRFGGVPGLRVRYVGEGNNSAASLALALSRYPDVWLDLRTPPGYGLAADVLARARAHARRSGARVTERADMVDLSPVDVVYTTRWQTTGTSKADPHWRRVFQPFRVTAALWERSPDAVFLHDLPAHRGDEVTADVLDGPASAVLDQAGHKLSGALAVLDFCRTGHTWT
ncbi:ornithine carbamoyltransferase [Saccharothrix xinjiangensis]|uniref:Ornithine carbamoyltransferase n=1 Tax=Saccharothrix xinjiangensis TaxID=204798 RepID=A0ABV9YCH0_9PSEU